MEQKLNFQNLPVRVKTDDDDQIWFAGIDICEILGYQNPNNIIKKLLDDDERKLEDLTDPSGQKRKTWIISESGLYSLIITSTKPEAKTFKRWVTHDVLPSIRKAGKFTTDELKQHEAHLQQLVKDIEDLNALKNTHNEQIKLVKQQLTDKNKELMQLIRFDRRQLTIQFPK
jgi:prophage antirepressor-like protein